MRLSRYLPLIIVLLVLFTSSVYYIWARSSAPAPLSSGNSGWDGASEALEVMEESRSVEIILSSPLMLRYEEEPRQTLYVALGPQREYTPEEVSSLVNFVERGGRVLLADDTGAVNPFTERFGIRITGYPVYDQYYIKNPAFLLVEVNVAGFSGVVLLDGPSTAESRYAVPWARTSEEGWIDFNRNGIRDPDVSPLEVTGSYPIIMEYNPLFHQNRSAGNILVIADSSIFMNDVLPRANNTLFLKAILSYMLPEGGKVLLDESLHSATDPNKALLKGFLQGLVYLQQESISWIVALFLIFLLPSLYIRFRPPEGVFRRRSVAPLTFREAFLSRKDLERLRRAALEILKERFGTEDVINALPLEQAEIKKLLEGRKMTEEEVNRCLIILSRM